MKKKAILLASFAVALVMAMGVTPAWGYFTDWTEANGGLVVNVTPDSNISEWYAERTKHVTISNTGQEATGPMFARVRVFASPDLEISFNGSGWTAPIEDANGVAWCYYGASVDEMTEIAPNDESKKLDIKIKYPPLKSETEPEGNAYGSRYNVIVYYEATVAQYRTDDAGNTVTFADWTRAEAQQQESNV